MKLFHAKVLAEELMYIHGLFDWHFAFDTAKKRFGCCHFTKKTITLSADLVALNTEDRVKETILHEIAHAQCGFSAGHGEVWKQTVASIGGVASRCYDHTTVKTPLMRYSAHCPQCHQTVQRRKKQRLLCRPCKAMLQWKENG